MSDPKLNLEKAIKGGHLGKLTNERVQSDGSKHITYTDDRNNRFSYDVDKDGNVSKAHSTHQDDGRHYNYRTQK